jgi:hypothetical protein
MIILTNGRVTDIFSPVFVKYNFAYKACQCHYRFLHFTGVSRLIESCMQYNSKNFWKIYEADHVAIHVLLYDV